MKTYLWLLFVMPFIVVLALSLPIEFSISDTRMIGLWLSSAIAAAALYIGDCVKTHRHPS